MAMDATGVYFKPMLVFVVCTTLAPSLECSDPSSAVQEQLILGQHTQEGDRIRPAKVHTRKRHPHEFDAFLSRSIIGVGVGPGRVAVPDSTLWPTPQNGIDVDGALRVPCEPFHHGGWGELAGATHHI